MESIIIDCDPGQDDAIAILMAIASDCLNILGITTVAGNVEGEQTYINAMKVCACAKRSDIKVYKGSLYPLKRKLIDAKHIHGYTGLTCSAQVDALQKESIGAVDFIVNTLLQSTEKVTIAATAALTNIALALKKAPQIQDHIERIVLMGGSSTVGNITPYAEFNFFTDPHAASIIFESGLDIHMIGLNVTNQTMFDEKLVERIKKIKSRVAGEVVHILSDLLKAYRNVYHVPGGIIHDGCVMAYLDDPSIFEFKKARVKIETEEEIRIGASYVTFDDTKPNARVAYGVNVPKLYDLMEKLIGVYKD